MMDWFEWNGVRSTGYGIHVLEQPPITIPSERATFTNVPGRPGSLTKLEGEDVYDDMILTATCMIDDPGKIPAIAAWLKGSGTVTFATRDGGFYYARIVNQIPFDKILRGNPHRSFAVNFRCKPFLYLHDTGTITLTADTGVITNPGSVYSEPIITVYGSGEITLMVNDSILELADIAGSITMDSELQEAYSGSTSMNACLSGDYLKLKPGYNSYSWSGDVSNIVIEGRWRSL